MVFSLQPVLKIANVRWKGRCSKHPKYDPRLDGEAGIRGGCQRCYALLAIYDQHHALMTALREFGSSAERKRAAVARPDNQPSLFD
jgi:hypothetical protein